MIKDTAECFVHVFRFSDELVTPSTKVFEDIQADITEHVPILSEAFYRVEMDRNEIRVYAVPGIIEQNDAWSRVYRLFDQEMRSYNLQEAPHIESDEFVVVKPPDPSIIDDYRVAATTLAALHARHAKDGRDEAIRTRHANLSHAASVAAAAIG